MGFQEAVKSWLSNYAKFDGRSSRSAFWWVFLALVILNIIVGILTAILGEAIGNLLSIIVGLGLLVPNVALSIRRFHDLNKSGWWVLIFLIPLVNIIAMIFFFVQKGTDGPNQYGPDPLGPDSAVFN